MSLSNNKILTLPLRICLGFYFVSAVLKIMYVSGSNILLGGWFIKDNLTKESREE